MTKIKIAKRIKKIKEMDDFIRANVDDEEILVDDWFAYGVPDCVDHETLEFIAFTDESYIDCLETFQRCIIKHVDLLMEEDF